MFSIKLALSLDKISTQYFAVKSTPGFNLLEIDYLNLPAFPPNYTNFSV